MNTDAIRENLKRGTIDLLLLSLLRHSDKYGYELKNELYERSLNKYELKEASMYPTLYRLVDNGYLTDNEVKVGKRRKRVYYHITEKGIGRNLSLILNFSCLVIHNFPNVFFHIFTHHISPLLHNQFHF